MCEKNSSLSVDKKLINTQRVAYNLDNEEITRRSNTASLIESII